MSQYKQNVQQKAVRKVRWLECMRHNGRAWFLGFKKRLRGYLIAAFHCQEEEDYREKAAPDP